jgi:hypothetical protein
LKRALKADNGGQRIETTIDTREAAPLPMSHPDAEPPEDVGANG